MAAEQHKSFAHTTFTIALVGDREVGKSSFVELWRKGTFTQNYSPSDEGVKKWGATIGLSHSPTQEKWKQKIAFRDITREDPSHLLQEDLEGVDGIAIFFSCTNLSSFERVGGWMEKVKEMKGDIPLIVVGNKLRKWETDQGFHLNKVAYAYHGVPSKGIVGWKTLPGVGKITMIDVQGIVDMDMVHINLMRVATGKKGLGMQGFWWEER